jgi:activator of 2-hydroxyglutaryl-CoA dehydratase
VSGGVAANAAVLHYLKNDYQEVIPLSDSSFNGAIGCCVYGKLLSKKAK